MNVKLYFDSGATKIDTNLHEGSLSISGKMENLSTAWSHLSDKQRLEMISSLIWTAPDMYNFHSKVEKLITSDKFKETLD